MSYRDVTKVNFQFASQIIANEENERQHQRSELAFLSFKFKTLNQLIMKFCEKPHTSFSNACPILLVCVIESCCTMLAESRHRSGKASYLIINIENEF